MKFAAIRINTESTLRCCQLLLLVQALSSLFTFSLPYSSLFTSSLPYFPSAMAPGINYSPASATFFEARALSTTYESVTTSTKQQSLASRVYYNPRLDPKNYLDGPLSWNPATRLRQMLARPGIVVSLITRTTFRTHSSLGSANRQVAPGICDGISARCALEAGFTCLYQRFNTFLLFVVLVPNACRLQWCGHYRFSSWSTRSGHFHPQRFCAERPDGVQP